MRTGVFNKTAVFAAAFAAMVSAGPTAAQPVQEKYHGALPIGAKWEMTQKNTGSYGTDRQVQFTRMPDTTWKGAPAMAISNSAGGTLLTRPEDGFWLAALAGGNPVISYEPALGFQYPWAVGRSWTQHYKTTNAKGELAEFDFSCTVEAYEKVAVPAGTFDAYRFACKTTQGSNDVMWASPGVGFVKLRLERSAGHPAGAGTQDAVMSVRPN